MARSWPVGVEETVVRYSKSGLVKVDYYRAFLAAQRAIIQAKFTCVTDSNVKWPHLVHLSLR